MNTWIKRTDRNPTADDTNDNGMIGTWKPGADQALYILLATWYMDKSLTHFLPLAKVPPLPVVEKTPVEKDLESAKTLYSHWWATKAHDNGSVIELLAEVMRASRLEERINFSAGCLDLFDGGSTGLEWIAKYLESESYYASAQHIRKLKDKLLDNCKS